MPIPSFVAATNAATQKKIKTSPRNKATKKL